MPIERICSGQRAGCLQLERGEIEAARKSLWNSLCALVLSQPLLYYDTEHPKESHSVVRGFDGFTAHPFAAFIGNRIMQTYEDCLTHPPRPVAVLAEELKNQMEFHPTQARTAAIIGLFRQPLYPLAVSYPLDRTVKNYHIGLTEAFSLPTMREVQTFVQSTYLPAGACAYCASAPV